MLAPHAALQTASVTSDLDRAVLLTCIARGMRYRAAIVIGAGTLGTRLGVAVYDTDDNKRPSVYELPVPPLDQHWRPVIADAVGFSVAVAVTPTCVYANESGMAGSKCDWRLETWRRLGPQANVDTMLEPDRGHTLTAAWVKSASPVRVESVAESPLWANQIHMFGPRAGSSVCDMSPRVAETQVAQAIQAWLVEQRGYLELDTTWDPELAHVLGQHLRARASGDASGSPGGGHAFDLTRVIRRTIPCGWMFRGAPHTTVTCPLGTHKLAVEVLVRRVMGEWARYAPAQAMVWEADTRARWAVAVVLEDAVGEGMDGGVFGCWVMVGVALPEAAEGESESKSHYHLPALARPRL
ncbi:hypothetical protein BCR44DRAFT_33595 [Catenaria anguillulae PL171]|uniref:Centrosomal protein of 76 kDa C-terminal domain-containing protein n=1 Tax=Catenaria anguillulae PL171 TaxID=765915 RepID=A0A1Y2HLS0_9FUNG|nr:hypothetical protein BCR44DRAFT_33595 [Catenaria anguillulae PL171]